MTKYIVEHTYQFTAIGEIEFPDGKTWQDVNTWQVKWCELTVWFKDGTTHTQFVETVEIGDIDVKRPDEVCIRPDGDEESEPVAHFPA